MDVFFNFPRIRHCYFCFQQNGANKPHPDFISSSKMTKNKWELNRKCQEHPLLVIFLILAKKVHLSDWSLIWILIHSCWLVENCLSTDFRILMEWRQDELKPRISKQLSLLLLLSQEAYNWTEGSNHYLYLITRVSKNRLNVTVRVHVINHQQKSQRIAREYKIVICHCLS